VSPYRGAAAAISVLAACLLGGGMLAACSGSSGSSAASTAAAPPVSSSKSAVAASSPTVPVPSTSSGSCAGAVVASATALQKALAKAQPGSTIVLAPGTYDGNFSVSHSGTASAPITLCGSPSSVLDGGSVKKGYTLHLDHASWWRLEGFAVTGGQKGVMLDGSDYDLVTGLYVHSIGDEGIHLREFSSHDTVSHCTVRNTGLLEQFYGEGIYVGSAHKNWCRYTNCRPDASNDDVISGNSIADTTAENIDIKEGTTGGQVIGNQFNGTGMVESAATAWVNVKGNDWTIAGNTGVDSIKDGFQVHQVYPGWGIGNVFRDNDAQVDGPGHGYYVQNKRLQTVVACDNKVSGAAKGLSTIACTSS
jgi:hypothetical protein